MQYNQDQKKSNNVLLRVSATALLILVLSILPWWFLLITGIATTLLFKKYYELIAIGFLFDMLYGMSESYTFIATLSAVFIYCALHVLKEGMRL